MAAECAPSGLTGPSRAGMKWRSHFYSPHPPTLPHQPGPVPVGVRRAAFLPRRKKAGGFRSAGEGRRGSLVRGDWWDSIELELELELDRFSSTRTTTRTRTIGPT